MSIKSLLYDILEIVSERGARWLLSRERSPRLWVGMSLVALGIVLLAVGRRSWFSELGTGALGLGFVCLAAAKMKPALIEREREEMQQQRRRTE